MPIRFEEHKDEVMPHLQLRIGNKGRVWGFTFLLDRPDVLYNPTVEEHYAVWVAQYCVHRVTLECDLWKEEVNRALANLYKWEREIYVHQHRTVLWPGTLENWQERLIPTSFDLMSEALLERVKSRIYHSVIHWKEDRS